MSSACKLTRCPSCEYEFPDEPRPISWFRRLLSREPASFLDACEQLISVPELENGENAEVVALPGDGQRHNRLAVFGLVPGAEITLVQCQPACVLRIGETELALDAEIARGILVKRPGSDPADPSQSPE